MRMYISTAHTQKEKLIHRAVSVSESQCSSGFYADTKECVHLGVKGLSPPVCYLPLWLADGVTY